MWYVVKAIQMLDNKSPMLYEEVCPMPEDEEFSEDEISDKEKQNFDEDVDNDEISPGEEGFLQGYDSSDEEETQKEEEKKE